MIIKTSELLQKCLELVGCRRIYTLPADLSLVLLSELEEAGIDVVSFPNEEAMIIAADIEAHLTGFSILICTDGYSVSKLLNGLIAAKLRHSSVLVIAVTHDLSLKNSSLLNCHPQPSRLEVMMQSIGLDCISVGALSTCDDFYNSFVKPQVQQQPVVLTITTHDVLQLRWDYDDNLENLVVSKHIKESVHANIQLQLLLNNYPDMLLVFGNGVNRFRSKISERYLKESVRQKYLLMPSAKGCLAETDSRFIGIHTGDFIDDDVKEIIDSANFVLLVEVEDHELSPGFWKPFFGTSNWSLREEYLANGKTVFNISKHMGLEYDGKYLKPLDWISVLFSSDSSINNIEPQRATNIKKNISSLSRYEQVAFLLNSASAQRTLVIDVGISCLPFWSYFVGKDSHFIANSVWANMGFCFAAGVAAYKVYPEQELWIVCGDGVAAMSMQDMLMFVRESIPVCIIILDNNGYLTEKVKASGKFNKGFAIDWCAYAHSIGFNFTAKIGREDSLEVVFKKFVQKKAQQSLLWIDIPSNSMPKALENLMVWQRIKQSKNS